MARFVGKDDAVVFNMGYNTNSSGIPMLVGKGTLVVSALCGSMTCWCVLLCTLGLAHVLKHYTSRYC